MRTATTQPPSVVRHSIEHEIRNLDRYLAIKARSVRHKHKWASNPYDAEAKHIDELLDQRIEYMRALEQV